MSAPRGSEQLDGLHAVREALRAGRRELRRLWLRTDLAPATRVELRGLADRSGVAIHEVAAGELPRRPDARGNPQGVVLEAGPIPEWSLDRLLERAAARGGPIVALDGVEDPRNVGAIARAADAAGAAGLLLTARRAPPLSPAVVRASAGAVEWLPVARVANLARALASAQAAGLWLVGADPAADTSLFEAPDGWLTGPTVLVLGAEGRGLRSGIERRLDHRVRIPMEGSVHSLNVASAAAVLLYELLRRRA